MDFLEALEKIEKSGQKEKLAHMTLCSALSFLDVEQKDPKIWEINYFDPKDKKITQLSVTSDAVKIHESAEPFNEKLQICKLPEGQIKVSAIDAILSAKEHQEKNFKQKIKKVFVSIQMEKDVPVWAVNFITDVLSIISVKIDAKTGKILSADSKNILRK